MTQFLKQNQFLKRQTNHFFLCWIQVEDHTEIKTTVICPFFVKTPLFDGIKSK